VIAAGAIALVVVLAVAAMVMAGRGDDRDAGMVSGGNLPANADPESVVDVAVSVDTVTGPGSIDGSVLVRLRGQTYRRGAQQIHVWWGPNVAIAMGDRSGIRPGAILQVRGVTRSGRAVQAQQLTVLTNFVHVEPPA
jgi:hypothetical protein